MDRDRVEVHKHAKNEQGQYSAILTEQAWSIKDLLYGKRTLIFLRDTEGIPERVLPARTANNRRRIPFILPAQGDNEILFAAALAYLGL